MHRGCTAINEMGVDRGSTVLAIAVGVVVGDNEETGIKVDRTRAATP